jgi:hypothetical protein
MKAFPDNAETGQLDMIVLVGDVFDGLLTLPDPVNWEIERWVVYMLRLCKKHNIVLRVLEGTPSHDWQQSVRFKIHNEASEIGCDVQYVTELSIERIESLGIDVLYVPDEWDDSTEKTLSQVHELMALKGIQQVDYAFMHGQFPHQLPEHIKSPKHDPVRYQEIVRFLIFIGHVHLYSRYGRIIAQGSFDRLSHGEEGAKGHIRATIRGIDDFDIQFVENVGARLFVTIECVEMDLAKTFQAIESRLPNIPDDSFVRLSCEPDNPIASSMDQLMLKYPLITWSKIIRSIENDQEKIKDESLDDDTFVPITITRDNISKLVLDRMSMKDHALTLVSRAQQFLVEMR